MRYYSILLVLLGTLSIPTILKAQDFRLSTTEAGLDVNDSRDHNGVSVADYDLDGDLDIYLVSSRQYDSTIPKTWNRLFRNEGNGQFSDVTEEAGVHSKVSGYATDVMGNKYGASWGDYDNDGDPDLFLTNVGPEILFRNDGDGSFSDVTEESGLTHSDDGSTTSSVWWDYDLDGDLDLYISVFSGSDTRNRLHENMGDGTFQNVTAASGLGDEGRTWTSMPIDADNDGLLDLYVVNDFGDNTFYRNRGDKTFEDLTTEYGLNNEGHGMGVTVGDYNNDGLFDIYLTNIAEHFPNPLFLNTGEARFDEQAAALGVEDAGWAWGTEFFDGDNDGDLDLYVANGSLLDPGSNYYYTNLLVGHGQMSFENSSELSGANGDGEGRGLTVFDYDEDGDLDLLVANRSVAPYLYKNESSTLNWLKVNLEGTTSNRNAFGATVRISANGHTMYRHNDGVEFLGQSVQPVHFGVGNATVIDEIVVRWPDGVEETYYDVTTNQTIRIIEGQELTTDVEDPALPAEKFTLHKPFPNPFNRSTAISFNIPERGDVVLTVYNILGREVISRKTSFASPGKYSLELDGGSFSNSGMYIYRLQWGNEILTGVISRVK